MEEILDTAHGFYAKNWCLATSGNFSARLSTGEILITASGKDKNRLSIRDFIAVDAEGKPTQERETLRPSAETLLHCRIYQVVPQAKAVFHSHSVYSTVLSQAYLKDGYLELSQYEMLKALEGILTHEVTVRIPILPNSQDMHQLAQEVEELLRNHKDLKAFLIANHGLYSWAGSLSTCRRQIEALEFLLECKYRGEIFDK
ncbi:MAG: methylthioribulose 1-phosphate dehydratase [Leptospiraceae bacterium]|nr:methylthioribulose 1-phosphate dehydratase [Leptospiraceae bacterium]